MRKISDKIYEQIDNDIYNIEGDNWWHPDFSLNLIRTFMNPVRVDYAIKRIAQVFKTDASKISVFEVGCGGGLLSEEFAGRGYKTTGIDPSEASLKTAMQHAVENNLVINYLKGTGEDIPFPSASFDVVLCCDVLEHVYDLPKVISEISRVLKQDGLFIYDTFNRTAFSKIGAVKILQEWKRWAIMPADLHVWKMFIKPAEIKSLLSVNHLIWKEHIGIKPDISYLKMMGYLRRRAAGELTNEEFGRKFRMVESRSTQAMYMGHAIKGQVSEIE